MSKLQKIYYNDPNKFKPGLTQVRVLAEKSNGAVKPDLLVLHEGVIKQLNYVSFSRAYGPHYQREWVTPEQAKNLLGDYVTEGEINAKN